METWEFNRTPIGTGPFMLTEWASGEYLSLVKNENYREEGKPYLDGINFLVVPAEEARTARMIEGDGDVMLWAGDEAEEQIEAAGTGTGRIAPGVWIVRCALQPLQAVRRRPRRDAAAPDPGRPSRARGDHPGDQPRADQPGAAGWTRLRHRLAASPSAGWPARSSRSSTTRSAPSSCSTRPAGATRTATASARRTACPVSRTARSSA